MADVFQQSLHARNSGFFGRASIAAGTRLVCLRRGKRFSEVCAIKHRRSLAVLTLCVCTGASGTAARCGARRHRRPPSAAQAKAKLAAVRERIAELTGRLGTRAQATRCLELASARCGSRHHGASAAGSSRSLRRERPSSASATSCDAEAARNRAALDAERASLAAQVRAQYMIGRADELRLLLSQTNPGRGGPDAAVLRLFRAPARGADRGDRLRARRASPNCRRTSSTRKRSSSRCRTRRAARSRTWCAPASSARAPSLALE